MATQKQEGGDDSINLQAGHDNIIINGLSYTETKEVVKDEAQKVFKENSLKLAEDAYKLVLERSDEFLDCFLHKLEKRNPESIQELKKPSMQYSLYKAQVEYSKTGDKALSSLLEDILVERAQNSQRDLLQIVLEQSIEIAPKLTEDQFDSLSLIFLLKYTKNQGIVSIAALNNYFTNNIFPFIDNVSKENSRYQHIVFSGCGNILVARKIEQIIREQYAGLFFKSFTKDEFENKFKIEISRLGNCIIPHLQEPNKLQLNGNDSSIFETLISKIEIEENVKKEIKNFYKNNLKPENEVREILLGLGTKMAKLFDIWDNSGMAAMNLTSVGIAIGHANIQRKTKNRIDLRIWIK
jgi:hypothetical protein